MPKTKLKTKARVRSSRIVVPGVERIVAFRITRKCGCKEDRMEISIRHAKWLTTEYCDNCVAQYVGTSAE